MASSWLLVGWQSVSKVGFVGGMTVERDRAGDEAVGVGQGMGGSSVGGEGVQLLTWPIMC
jgi:hypothetical protein